MSDRGSAAVIEITARAALPRRAGGKALGLKAILAAGLDAPRAWVVLPEATEADVHALARLLREERVGPLAVRSSASDEDGAATSFAGIHESLLSVALDDLPTATRRVASSTLTARARAYRKALGLAPAGGPCAVVVQALVAAERSGVALGLDDDDRFVLIEAVEGLAERLVQGLETPEAWHLQRDGDEWRVQRHRSRRQNVALLAGDRQCRAEDRLGGAATAPVLRVEEAERVADGVLVLQAAAGRPLEVEWCAAGERLFFVQSRPRTRPTATLPPGQTWSRANFREVLPELVAGLSRSFAFTSIRRALRRYMAPFRKLLPRDVPYVECVYGRLVSNDSAYAELLEKLGIPRRLMDVTLGGGDGGEDRFEPMRLSRQLRRPVTMARALLRALLAPRAARRVMTDFHRARDEVLALSLRDLSDAELLPWLESTPLALGARFALASMLIVVYLQNVQYRIAALLRALPHPGALTTRLVAPRVRTVSTLMTDELVELAHAFRRMEGGGAFLANLSPAHADCTPWRAQLPADLYARVARWIEQFGHRGPYESDLASTRYADDWRLMAEILKPLVDADREPESPVARRARFEEDAVLAWEDVCAHLGFLKRAMLRGQLRALARLLALREELRSATIACIHEMRAAFVEAGRRLEERARLPAWDDVWLLEIEELTRALRDPEFDVAGAAARERGRLAAWRRIEVPNRFRSEDVVSFHSVRDERTQPVDRMRGTGVSPGLVEGRARLLETPYGSAELRAGEILVAQTTDPGWTPLFARAGGVLVEMGGTLSHAGIVAREFGIPCVSNLDGVMRRICDGQWLHVDGTHGTVQILPHDEGDGPSGPGTTLGPPVTRSQLGGPCPEERHMGKERTW